MTTSRPPSPPKARRVHYRLQVSVHGPVPRAAAARPPPKGPPTTRFVDVAGAPPPVRPAGAKAPPPGWVRRHKVVAALMAVALAAAGTAVAALLLRQDVATTPSTAAPDVKFLTGTDYAAINAAGFATVSIGSSGASASLALSGVSGAALVTLGNVMRLQNTDATQEYEISLARSTGLNAAITSFVVTIKDGVTTLLTWNPVSSATSSAFTLEASKTLDITVALVVLDGTAAGALGSFDMQFEITPV